MDAFLASKLAEFAAGFGATSSVSLDSSSILTEWDKALEFMTNQRINRDRLIGYFTPNAYKLLKQATGLTRFIEVTNGIQAVDRNVARLDGVQIVEVPSDMMKDAYTFTEGWAIGSSAHQINFILVDPMAVAAPIKYETAMMSAPTAQSKGKYLYYERYYYGAFVLNQRQAGVYAHIATAPSAGTLTLTSTAGATSGASVLDVAGHGIAQNGTIDEGLKLMINSNNSTDSVTLTYGQALPAGTWTEATATPVTLTSQTANYYTYAALVNKQTGYVVAGGKTQNVVGA